MYIAHASLLEVTVGGYQASLLLSGRVKERGASRMARQGKRRKLPQQEEGLLLKDGAHSSLITLPRPDRQVNKRLSIMSSLLSIVPRHHGPTVALREPILIPTHLVPPQGVGST